MVLSKDEKKDVMKTFKKHDKDTGSAQVQIALLTTRINKLTEHLQSHAKDHASRRGLLKMVGQRRKLLNYLFQENHNEYLKIIEQLKIRK